MTALVAGLALVAMVSWRLRPRRRRLPGRSPAPARSVIGGFVAGAVRNVGAALVGAAVGSRRRADRADAALEELPETIDLLVLAVSAGLTVPLAVETVAERSTGVVADGFRAALARSRLGEPLVDTLETLPVEVGEPVRVLVRPLVSSLRYGTELLPALEMVAAEVRLQRRRRAEMRARRLPVKLLFPLVLCVLPAFALLTVVPVVAESLRAIRL